MKKGERFTVVLAMKVSLRDLFWLILLAATLTVWGAGHHRKAKAIAVSRRDHWFLKIDDYGKPTDAELERRHTLKKLSKLTDDELDAHFAAHLDGQRSRRPPEYEPCLVEMARRGLASRLQRHYDALMAQDGSHDGFTRFPQNLELLTALRRAQRKPDPVILEVELNNRPPWAADYGGPCLSAIVRNMDVGRQAVNFTDGCDDRGGRRERWRFVLTDEQGHEVPDSNYAPMMGGGVGSFGPLEYGETGHRFNFFELRKYIAPPPSGKYQLQALYHNEVSIADERDVSGLIVSNSNPISVIVDNLTPTIRAAQRREGREPLIILAACAVLTVMATISGARTRRMPDKLSQPSHLLPILGIRRRDLCWGLVVGVLAIGMWLDRRHQAAQIVDVRPHAAADWSIRLVNESRCYVRGGRGG